MPDHDSCRRVVTSGRVELSAIVYPPTACKADERRLRCSIGERHHVQVWLPAPSLVARMLDRLQAQLGAKVLILHLELDQVVLEELHALRGADDDLFGYLGQAPQAEGDDEGADGLGGAAEGDVDDEADDDDGGVEDVEPRRKVACFEARG